MKEISTQKRIINLPFSRRESWLEALPREIKKLSPGLVDVNCNDWLLTVNDLKKLINLINQSGMRINVIQGNIRETIVSASALGEHTQFNLPKSRNTKSQETSSISESGGQDNFLFHKGTLRSGEHLESDGDVLLLGDVNPGAKISAEGNVMIWGRLLGIAHAGKAGNTKAKIIALQLRPVQLRIASKVARGPEEKPQEGLAEEALIQSGQIVIKPAKTNSSRFNNF